MHRAVFGAVGASLLLVSAAGAEDEPKPGRAWPGGDRASLAIPDDVWDRVLAGTAPARRPLGYTGDEMRNYGGRDHLLRTVENLFRDVRTIPRDTGRITDDLLKLAAEGKVDEVVQRCWTLTDVPAGRMYEAPNGDDWGLEGVAKGASCETALRALLGPGKLRRKTPDDGGPAIDVRVDRHEETAAALTQLPEPLLRFILRLAVGHRQAARWIDLAPPPEPAPVQPPTPIYPEPPRRARSAAAIVDAIDGPWTDEAGEQTATRDAVPFRLLRDSDRSQVAYGAVVFLAHLAQAAAELRPWFDAGGRAELAAAKGLPWSGVVGGFRVSILGAGDDVIVPSDLWGSELLIDVGGSDRWGGGVGVSSGPDRQVALAVDLGGDDVWGDADATASLGCGVFGLGAVIDLGGNDTYTVKSDGLGRGLFGTGLLWDLAGDDAYVVKTKWGQGAAHAGVGVLLDVAGNDRYECAEQSQGLGSTLGCGLLLDLAGNDSYVCRDDGNVSALYLNQSVAMAQGCGYGRRADIGDGRSLAGGWGLLVDGAGDDRYHAQCWSQGCGYWWGVGVLEDRGGNDVYENGKYSLGAGAHFAIGVQVDLAGDDRYNVGVATTKNQFQGHARDGSIGVSIDGDGNDRYHLKNLCAGSADLASVALFWDRRGDDVYEAAMEKDMGDTAPFGSATVYTGQAGHRSFRDDLPAVGVFLDTGGKDTYSGDPRAIVDVGARAKDGATWLENKGAASFGFGLDERLWE